jgi:hypothetical protein
MKKFPDEIFFFFPRQIPEVKRDTLEGRPEMLLGRKYPESLEPPMLRRLEEFQVFIGQRTVSAKMRNLALDRREVERDTVFLLAGFRECFKTALE